MLKLVEEKDLIELKSKVARLEKLVGKVICLKCKGDGQIEESMGSHSDFFVCDSCGGSGLLIEKSKPMDETIQPCINCKHFRAANGSVKEKLASRWETA